MGRKNNCELNFCSMYFVGNNEEIHLSFKNSEKLQTQALNICYENHNMVHTVKKQNNFFWGGGMGEGGEGAQKCNSVLFLDY